MSNDETTTATPRPRAKNVVVKGGAIQVTTLNGYEGALLTVRGKDHDLTSAECRELAKAFNEAADLGGTARS